MRASQTDTLKVFDFSRDLKSHFEHQDSHLSKGVHHRSNLVFSPRGIARHKRRFTIRFAHAMLFAHAVCALQATPASSRRKHEQMGPPLTPQ